MLTCELQLPEQASLANALEAARVMLGEVADWEAGATGVFGALRSRDYVPLDGERIELYRPLPVDPRAARRARAVQRATAARAPRVRQRAARRAPDT